MKRLIFLSLIAHFCMAQNGAYVANAVGPSSSRTNVLARGMLATVNENGFFVNGPALSHAASVFIRPFGVTTSIPAAVVSAQTGTVTFVVPITLPFGTAELAWQIDGAPYRSINVTIAQSNFELTRIALFGPALAQIMSPGGSVAQVGLTAPARPGQALMLFGSGLGYGTQVTAALGGLPAFVVYSGRDGLRTGYDQIQVQIPAGIADGCYVPLTLNVGSSVVTSTVSITADGAPCRHPFQLPVADMKTLDNGGVLATGEIVMNTNLQAALASAVSRQEGATFNVSEKTAADLARYFTLSAGTTGCTAFTTQGLLGAILSGNFVNVSNPIPLPPTLGDSVTLAGPGATLKLSGTGGTFFSATIAPAQDGTLTNLPAPAIAGGKWIWSSAGSPDIAPSSFPFVVPSPIQVNSGAPLSLRRDQDQTIAWNGAALDPATMVTIFLNGHSADGSGTRGVSCVAAAQAGSITIPAALLQPFAAASIGSFFAQTNVSGAAMPHTMLNTKSGATLLMVVSWSASDNRPVDFR